MHRGAWWATVHGVAKSQTGLSDLPTAATTVSCISIGSSSTLIPSSFAPDDQAY